MDRDAVLLLLGCLFAMITFNFQDLKLMWWKLKNHKKQAPSEEKTSEDES